MALKIRLRQQGSKNNQSYRIVVADEKVRRDGKYVEKLGWYIPCLTQDNCSIDGDRLEHWLSKGAQMSDQVKSLADRIAPEAMRRWRQSLLALQQQRILKKREKRKASK